MSEGSAGDAPRPWLAQGLPDGILVVDASGRVQFANPAAGRILGYSQEDLLGSDLLRLLPVDVPRARVEALAGYLVEGGGHLAPRTVEMAARHRSGRSVPVQVSFAKLDLPEGPVVAATLRDGAEGRALRSHILRQSAVAELGRRALTEDLDRLLDDAVGLVVQTLGVGRAEVEEVLSSREAFLLRAGCGWRPGQVGRRVLAASGQSHPGCALLLGGPLVFEDLEREHRFRGSGLLVEEGVVSGVMVVVERGHRPFGVLGAYDTRPRSFSEDDRAFLQAVAHLLGLAIERQRGRARLRESEARFRALIERAADGIALLDRTGAVTWAGPSTARVLGYAPEQIQGRSLVSLVHPRDRHLARRAFAQALARPGETVTLEARARHRDASWRSMESALTNLLDAPDVGALVLNYRDVTARKQAEEQIRHQAQHDPLTDLPNRSLFLDRLEQAMVRAHRRGRGVALLLLDLDHFKRVNDALGHVAGDRLLRVLAGRLRGAVREEDTVARIGGDEFALLLQDALSAEDAVRVATALVESIARPVDLDGQETAITGSLGISLYPVDGEEAETLLRHADHALYRAKQVGRNGFRLCTPEMNREFSRRVSLARALDQALSREELELYYQPEFAAETGELTGVEALIRWRHPTAGLLLPEQFLGLAEDTRLIVPIGEWVLWTACRQAEAWRRAWGRPLRVAVNLSGTQLQQRSLGGLVGRVVGEVARGGASLEIEITETVAMRDEEVSDAQIEALRGLGVGVAIDDFGTGYSSLAVLHRFPFRSLKIDRSFVARLDDGAAAMVRAIITMAHSLGLRVVAEGVESPDQLAFLRREGCDELQGFLLGRPLPPGEIKAPPSLASSVL